MAVIPLSKFSQEYGSWLLENQKLMTPEQKAFCRSHPHLIWVNPKTNGIKDKKLRMIIYKRDGGICRLCGCALSVTFFTIDHIVLVSRGGSDEEDNLQLACKPCNSSKGAKCV